MFFLYFVKKKVGNGGPHCYRVMAATDGGRIERGELAAGDELLVAVGVDEHPQRLGAVDGRRRYHRHQHVLVLFSEHRLVGQQHADLAPAVEEQEYRPDPN